MMGERTIKQEIECFERFIETGDVNNGYGHKGGKDRLEVEHGEV